VAEAPDYLEKLRADMLEQFRGKPNIEAFNKALARQLSELHGFFAQLLSLRSLQGSEGAQLDGIGSIVALSRADALSVAQTAEKHVPMDDATYRLYLIWKKSLNTTGCTHKDVYGALKMFWDKTPLYYSEDPAQPATMIYTVPRAASEHEKAVFRIASMVKAAGVSLHFIFPGDEYSVTDYSGGAACELIRERFYEQEDYAHWREG